MFQADRSHDDTAHAEPADSSTTAAHVRRPPKLRLACDACTVSKVRCSRTCPCDRCLEIDGTCRYSASRRHGRRASHKQANSSVAQQQAAQAQSPLPASSSSSMPETTSSAISMVPPVLPVVSESSEMATTGNSFSYNLAEDWAFNDANMTFDVQDGLFTPLSDQWSMGNAITPSGSSPNDSRTNLFLFPPQQAMMVANPAVVAGTGNESPSSGRRSHNCETLALRILESIHYNIEAEQMDPSSSSVANTMNFGDSPCSAPSTDTVLLANQAALANLAPLTKCTCVRDPHIALLYSTIISKVIFWYRVAIAGRYLDHASSQDDDGVGLRPMKMQLGALDLDEDDQATVQRAVLLRELSKAERVVETFDVGSSSSHEDDPPAWHGLAIRKMRKELQDMSQEIRREQKESH